MAAARESLSSGDTPLIVQFKVSGGSKRDASTPQRLLIKP
jgi:hypothetical protein